LLPGIMGNSAGSASGWFFSEEVTLVLLRLHDVRCVGLSLGEEVSGVINSGADSPNLFCVRRSAPVSVPVGAGTTLTVEFQAVPTGNEVGGGRVLGSVVLPLEHIARRCCGSLYHMWLPLDGAQSSNRGGGSSMTTQPSLGSDAHTLDNFDRALRSAARDPRFPLVCLSLCQADSSQAEKERYELNAEAADKALRFYSLLQSHAQHSRLLQALYRQSRSGRAVAAETDNRSQMLPQLRDALVDSWASLAQARSFQFTRNDSLGPELSGASEVTNSRSLDTSVGAGLIEVAAGPVEDASRLRLDIETTTREANARINQASDAIRTLKERLSAKQAEHERLRKETVRIRRDADALENENEQLRLCLERRAREQGCPGDREEEMRRLRREAEVLGEQKDALVLILEDLYGAVGRETGAVASAGVPPAPGAAAPREPPGSLLPPPEPAMETFTHLLPRPSELFASGALDDRAAG